MTPLLRVLYDDSLKLRIFYKFARYIYFCVFFENLREKIEFARFFMLAWLLLSTT